MLNIPTVEQAIEIFDKFEDGIVGIACDPCCCPVACLVLEMNEDVVFQEIAVFQGVYGDSIKIIYRDEEGDPRSFNINNAQFSNFVRQVDQRYLKGVTVNGFDVRTYYREVTGAQCADILRQIERPYLLA